MCVDLLLHDSEVVCRVEQVTVCAGVCGGGVMCCGGYYALARAVI